ncbi:MAG: O-methyltransferase [Chitinophagia bacterium]|nr:O-methyltransferase [Chitinophagia bacterium]
MTTQLIPPSIESYACDYSTEESLVLAQLNRETHLKVNLPIMLSGHLQGKVLEFISHMIQPKQVLEIGTYTGYSAICLAAGLKENGVLHTIDINEELYDMCQSYFEKAGLSEKIIQHIGHAADIIPRIDCIFDLVFIDADKQNYHLYYDLVIDRLPIGAYILADNVLYDGEVLLAQEEQSKNAKAIQAFNEKIRADKRVIQVLLPIRDGLLLMKKISD